MLTLLLSAVLAQEPQCLTAGGTRVCGYSCVENGVEARCAKTPDGVCGKNASQVTCFDPPMWLKPLAMGTLPKPACLSFGGNLACGYDCKREGSIILCAQTPKGVCATKFGRITCFDPPPEVYAVLQAAVPPPSCMDNLGPLVCGYDCRFSNGVNACARTPFGVCDDDGGVPRCFDPPKEVICAKGKSVPKPKCVRSPNGPECGYECKQAGATVACAKTPDGTCDTSGPSGPVCFDPPVRGGTAACLEAAAASK